MIIFTYGLRITSIQTVMEIFSDTLKDYYANVYKPSEMEFHTVYEEPYKTKLFEVDQWDEILGKIDGNPLHSREWNFFGWALVESWWRHDSPPYFQQIEADSVVSVRDNDSWIIGYSLAELHSNSFSLTELPDVQDADQERWDKLCDTFPNLRRQASPTIVVSATSDDGSV